MPATTPRTFAFQVRDATGAPRTDFAVAHGVPRHLIVVRRDLTGFQHLHPQADADGTWSVPLTVPEFGTYRAFRTSWVSAADGTPTALTLGADVLVAGDFQSAPLPDPAPAATTGPYTVRLDHQRGPGGSAGLRFTVERDGQPVTDLQPHLGALGHLVALRAGDLAYLHVHPDDAADTGPTVGFATTFSQRRRLPLVLPDRPPRHRGHHVVHGPPERHRRAAMTRFDLLTPESARGKARDLLGDLVARHGQVGDMVRTMAHSPALLASYLDLSRAMIRTKLDRGLSERVSVAVQAHLGCQTCLDAHTEAARQIGLSDDEIDAARRATSPDARIDALLRFALTVATEPARVGDPDLATLRDHGYADREILDVVGIVALNQLTGTLNLVAGL